MNIYEEMLKVCDKEEISNHESDLYVPVTLRTTNIINMYKFKDSVTIFKCNITGKLYYDITFAYTPYWNKKVV